MNGNSVETLVICGANPVYTAPADLAFERALHKVPVKVHHGLYVDETAVACDWHIPASHALEEWGDLRSFDGTLSLQQPCVAPLYGGRSTAEMMAALNGDVTSSARELLLASWRAQHSEVETFIDETLRRGFVADSAFAPASPALRSDLAQLIQSVATGSGDDSFAREWTGDDVELVFVPDPRIRDGSFANNPWLQELPSPLSQLTWGNAALIAPALATRLGVANEDEIELRVGERSIEVPAWIMPGMPDRSVSLALGHGRTQAGNVGNGHGVDAYRIRTSKAPWNALHIGVEKTGRRQPLACVQTHHSMEGRDIVRLYSAAEADHCTPEHCGTPNYRQQRTLYDSPPTRSYAWAMSIDLTACIGCGTCTIACQAENNIPTVGFDEVRRGREMHWIRVDRYYEGAIAAPRVLFQPVPCMQCEHAPCEVVCPVGASVHDAQGINVQVYNRCVGTRFCSNNCPYKVRRFNFFQYAQDTPARNAQRNPEVTVRMRGVMEKCNYCLQRITTAKIAADRDGRQLRDGDVITACQAACPTRAIVFGDLNDPASEVNRHKDSPLTYALLAELNTRPRTTYLARVINVAGDR
jgi:molybdopterin-containing oxidoreductase family iron-sulfur binding subunit